MHWSFLSRWSAARGRDRKASKRRRVGAEPLETLESRQLLATSGYSFVTPDLKSLERHPDATAAMFNRLVGSLQAQLVLGPLADLKDLNGAARPPRIKGDQYVVAVTEMVQGFTQATAQQEPNNRPLNQLVQLQGDALKTQVIALNARRQAGLTSDTASPGTTSAYYNESLVAAEHLTLSRPLWPYGTPILNYINRTEDFQSQLATLAEKITKLGMTEAVELAHVEAASYWADIRLATFRQPGLGTALGQQVSSLLTQIDAAAQSGASGADAFNAAVRAFRTATYDRVTGDGLLGPRGAYGENSVQPTTGSSLPYYYGNTFHGGRYIEKTLKKPAVYHRNFVDATNQKGRYLTTSLYPNPAVAIRRSALDQTFLQPNSAFYVTDVVVPAKLKVYVGRVAPIYQGVLTHRNTLYPGLGPQVVVSDSFNPGIVYQNQRTTGT